MKMRTKIFLLCAAVVLILWLATLWPIHQAAVSGAEQISDQAFDGTTQTLRSFQTARLGQMRQACQLAVCIPDLHNLISQNATDLTPDNLDTLQDRLDNLADLVAVRSVFVLNAQGKLLAQNRRSAWDSLSQLRFFLNDSPQAAVLVRTLFHPAAKSPRVGQDALWQYNGQFFDVVGVPLTFTAPGQSADQTGPIQGAIIMASPLSDELAAALASSHNCDVSFIAGTTLSASSLSTEKRNILANLFANNAVTLPDEYALNLQGVTYRGSMLPLIDPCSQTLVGGMWVQTDLQKIQAASTSASHQLWIVLLIGLVLAGAGSFYFSNHITKTLDALVDAVRRITDGDLSVAIPKTEDRDEFSLLGDAVNDMVAQLKTQRQLQKTVDSSRINTGQIDLESVPFNPRTVVSDVLDLLAQRVGGKRVQLVDNLTDNLPRTVTGDPNRLRQILINLVNNAIAFTDSGAITVKAFITALQDNLVTIGFEVVDTGAGIPADQIQTLLQSDPSTARIAGTGQGLLICKQLVERMGGQFAIDSTVGVGTTVRFTAVFVPDAAPVANPFAMPDTPRPVRRPAPRPIPTPAQPIEMADLLSRFSDKPQDATAVLQQFQTQSNQALDNLRQCVQELDADQLASIAHTLKASAGLAAASGVARIAASIEQAGQEADFSEAELLLGQLQDEVLRCAQFVAQAAAANPDSPAGATAPAQAS